MTPAADFASRRRADMLPMGAAFTAPPLLVSGTIITQKLRVPALRAAFYSI